MKIKNCLVMLTSSVVVLTSSGRIYAHSQLYSERDGIAASPKFREILDYRNLQPMKAPMGGAEMVGEPVIREPVMREDMNAGSPKFRDITREQYVQPSVEVVQTRPVVKTPQSAGYRVVGDDGIAASPKLREKLDQERRAAEIAPLR